MTTIALPAHLNADPACPTCEAGPDEDCRTTSGKPRRDWHVKRVAPMRLDVDTWALSDLDPTVVPELVVHHWTPLFGNGKRSVSLDAEFPDGSHHRVKLASVQIEHDYYIYSGDAAVSAEALKALLLDNDFPALWASWIEQALTERIEELREKAAKYGFKLVPA